MFQILWPFLAALGSIFLAWTPTPIVQRLRPTMSWIPPPALPPSVLRSTKFNQLDVYRPLVLQYAPQYVLAEPFLDLQFDDSTWICQRTITTVELSFEEPTVLSVAEHMLPFGRILQRYEDMYAPAPYVPPVYSTWDDIEDPAPCIGHFLFHLVSFVAALNWPFTVVLIVACVNGFYAYLHSPTQTTHSALSEASCDEITESEVDMTVTSSGNGQGNLDATGTTAKLDEGTAVIAGVIDDSTELLVDAPPTCSRNVATGSSISDDGDDPGSATTLICSSCEPGDKDISDTTVDTESVTHDGDDPGSAITLIGSSCEPGDKDISDTTVDAESVTHKATEPEFAIVTPPSPPPEEETVRPASPTINSPLPTLPPTPPDSDHDLDPDSDDDGNAALLAYLEQRDREIDEEEAARLATLEDVLKAHPGFGDTVTAPASNMPSDNAESVVLDSPEKPECDTIVRSNSPAAPPTTAIAVSASTPAPIDVHLALPINDTSEKPNPAKDPSLVSTSTASSRPPSPARAIVNLPQKRSSSMTHTLPPKPSFLLDAAIPDENERLNPGIMRHPVVPAPFLPPVPAPVPTTVLRQSSLPGKPMLGVAPSINNPLAATTALTQVSRKPSLSDLALGVAASIHNPNSVHIAGVSASMHNPRPTVPISTSAPASCPNSVPVPASNLGGVSASMHNPFVSGVADSIHNPARKSQRRVPPPPHHLPHNPLSASDRPQLNVQTPNGPGYFVPPLHPPHLPPPYLQAPLEFQRVSPPQLFAPQPTRPINGLSHRTSPPRQSGPHGPHPIPAPGLPPAAYNRSMPPTHPAVPAPPVFPVAHANGPLPQIGSHTAQPPALGPPLYQQKPLHTVPASRNSTMTITRFPPPPPPHLRPQMQPTSPTHLISQAASPAQSQSSAEPLSEIQSQSGSPMSTRSSSISSSQSPSPSTSMPPSDIQSTLSTPSPSLSPSSPQSRPSPTLLEFVSEPPLESQPQSPAELPSQHTPTKPGPCTSSGSGSPTSGTSPGPTTSEMNERIRLHVPHAPWSYCTLVGGAASNQKPHHRTGADPYARLEPFSSLLSRSAPANRYMFSEDDLTSGTPAKNDSPRRSRSLVSPLIARRKSSDGTSPDDSGFRDASPEEKSVLGTPVNGQSPRRSKSLVSPTRRTSPPCTGSTTDENESCDDDDDASDDDEWFSKPDLAADSPTASCSTRRSQSLVSPPRSASSKSSPERASKQDEPATKLTLELERRLERLLATTQNDSEVRGRSVLRTIRSYDKVCAQRSVKPKKNRSSSFSDPRRC